LAASIYCASFTVPSWFLPQLLVKWSQHYRDCRIGYWSGSWPLRSDLVQSASIGPGEREVISLGLELGAGLLILDEQPARRLAKSVGLRVIGTVGILLTAKERGHLSSIRPELDRLLAVNFFMDQDLYEKVIGQAGE
jgi:hypothetical protein